MEQLPQKLIFWNTVQSIWAAFLCLFTDQNIGDTLCCLCLIFLNNVAVEVFRCVHAGMTKLFDNIRAVCQKHRGHRMPERMRIDMGQTVAGGEIFEPSGDAVQTHVIAVFLCKDVAGIKSRTKVVQKTACFRLDIHA